MFSVLGMPSHCLSRLLPGRLRSWLARLSTDDTSSDLSRPPVMRVVVVFLAVLATVCAAVIGDASSSPPAEVHQARSPAPMAAAPKVEPRQDSSAVCVSSSAPNPIAAMYPNAATGVLNGTLAVMPIPMAEARRIIPSQWGILEGAMRAVLPNFPKGMYPVFIQAVNDHDVKMYSVGFGMPDFSVGFPQPIAYCFTGSNANVP